MCIQDKNNTCNMYVQVYICTYVCTVCSHVHANMHTIHYVGTYMYVQTSECTAPGCEFIMYVMTSLLFCLMAY